MNDDIITLGSIVDYILDEGVENHFDLTNVEHFMVAEDIVLLAGFIEELMTKGT